MLPCLFRMVKSFAHDPSLIYEGSHLPTLDQILDKINSKGYESLTPFEQDVLEGYSKN